MSKTSAKTFLSLIHKLNADMDKISTDGQDIIIRVRELDFTSITDPSTEEELVNIFEETGQRFRELNNMKQILLDGLRKKVIQKLNSVPLNSRVKSLSLRGNRGLRKTRRVRSI